MAGIAALALATGAAAGHAGERPAPSPARVTPLGDGWLRLEVRSAGAAGVPRRPVAPVCGGDGARVVARAPVPVALPPPYPPPTLPAALAPRAGALGLAKDRSSGPVADSSAAGLRWMLGPHLALGLAYERTTLGKPVPRDPGNGVRTSVRVGF